MTLSIAGLVDVDLQALAFLGASFAAFLLVLLCYGVARRITGGQALVIGCIFLAAFLFFIWLLALRIPSPALNALFYLLQPYLSVGLAIVAALYLPKAFFGHTHK